MQDLPPQRQPSPLLHVQGEPKLKTQLQSACRRKGYAFSTERTYWRWVVRYVRHSATGEGDLPHPRQLGAEDGPFVAIEQI